MYLRYDEKIELRIYFDTIMGILVKDNKKFGSIKKFEVNESTAKILERIDGKTSITDIAQDLAKIYNDDILVITEKINNLIYTLRYSYDINIYETDIIRPVLFTKNLYTTEFPSTAAIELTYACNLRCLHCYGSFGEQENIFMKRDEAISVLHNLNKNGIRIVELTGGDISVYPYLYDILNEALKLDFDFITLLTNGIQFSDRIKELIANNSARFKMQIDLHSLDEEYLKWFTQRDNILTSIKKNIKYFISHGVFVRIATICTNKNLDELEDIAKWVKKSGANGFGFSTVASIGRAKNADPNLYFLEEERIIEFSNKLGYINETYPELGIGIKPPGYIPRKNCGVLYSEVVITPTGDIKLCIMDDTNVFKNKIGNAITQDLKTIFQVKAELVKEIAECIPPNFTSPECKSCTNILFCNGCISRAISAIIDNPDQCKWYKNNLGKHTKSLIAEALQN